MNLYLISQSTNVNYDAYDAAVVCAENEQDARTIHPDNVVDGDYDPSNWTTINNVQVTLIGKADDSLERGVVLASFHGG